MRSFHGPQESSRLTKKKKKRYKYLQKPLEDNSLPTLLQYVNKWEPDRRDRLAATIGLILAQGLASATCLQSLTKDHLVKNGTPLAFIVSPPSRSPNPGRCALAL
jgi:hypothetical protein